MTEEHKMNLTILGALLIIIVCLCAKEYETRKKGIHENGTRQSELSTATDGRKVQIRGQDTTSP